MFFTAGPQPGSCFPIHPSQLVFQNKLSVTLTTPRQKLPHLHQLPGKNRLAKGVSRPWDQAPLLARLGKPGGRSAAVSGPGSVLLDKAESLPFLVLKATLEVSRNAAHVSCCWRSWSCSKLERLVGLEGNVACWRVQHHVWPGSQEPCQGSLWLLPHLWLVAVGGK